MFMMFAPVTGHFSLNSKVIVITIVVSNVGKATNHGNFFSHCLIVPQNKLGTWWRKEVGWDTKSVAIV